MEEELNEPVACNAAHGLSAHEQGIHGLIECRRRPAPVRISKLNRVREDTLDCEPAQAHLEASSRDFTDASWCGPTCV